MPPRSPLRSLGFQAGFWLATLGAPALASAQAGLPAHAPAGTGQPALSVFAGKAGELMAASCASAPCSAGATAINLPAELRNRPAQAQLVSLGQGRHALVVTVADGTRTFKAVVVAPLAGGTPKVLFGGLTGLTSGQPGERNGKTVQVVDAGGGVSLVLVGEEWESVSLCGRPTILAPQLLNPKTLELQGAKVQRLSLVERDAAVSAQVRRMADDEPSAAATGVLRGLSASSAVGAPQAVTDGDPETTWSEDRGGDGKGEFIVLRSPPETPISGLELTIRPPKRALEHGAAPSHLFVAGPREVIEVTLPEDAWQSPGARYRVTFSKPLQSSCLAISLDTAFGSNPKAQVTLAEVAAVTEFDSSKLEELVRTLAGGGQRAEAARSVLVAGGRPAFEVVAKTFASLDEGGRRVALTVMDAAPCELSAPVYVAALTSKVEAQQQHAQSRLRRCGAPGGEALAAALAKSDKTDKLLMPLLITELAVTDPVRAVSAFVPLLDEKTVARRRLLRTALAQVARTQRAAPALRSVLADPKTSPVAIIDLLRALGDEAARYEPEASAALVRAQQGSPAFRTRYLLLGPTSVLGRSNASVDATFRQRLGADPDAQVRAAALSLVRQPKRYQGELLKALGDPQVRVREASVRALGLPEGAFASQQLLSLLGDDQWPLVRAAAADALAKHPAGDALDKPLAQALGDESPLVRARSIRALAERRAGGVASRIRDRLIDEEEFSEVRAEAARALGELCDAESADILAAFAKKLADPMASPDAQLIATGAVMSLGRLAQPSLKEALAPLSGKKAPPHARRAAATALSARDTCRAGSKP